MRGRPTASPWGSVRTPRQSKVGERVGWVRDGAGRGFNHLELKLSFMAVGGQIPRCLQMTLGKGAAKLAESDAIPVLKGPTEQMCDRLQWLRDQFGLSYFVAGDELMDALAPVVERLAGK